MLTIIEVVLPVFGLIMLGFCLGKARLFSQAGVADISRFIFYLAVPALIFRTGATGLAERELELGVLLAYYGSNLAIFFAGLFIGRRWLGLSATETPVFAMGATFSNLVLVGLPVVQARFGEEGLVALMTIISINTLTFFTLPSTLIEIRLQGDGSPLRSLAITLRSVLHNPLVLAILCGFGWGLSGWPLPYVIDRFTALLGQAASPCALFAVGASLAQYRLRGSLHHATLLCVLKLLVAPTLVWLTGHYLLSLSPLWLAVATLAAAMPTGANVFVLSQRYDRYAQSASSAILLSTFAALLTLTLLLLALADL